MTDLVTNDITGVTLPIKTGDPSIDYAQPSTDNVTVEGLDVTRYAQGSMAAVHGMRLPSYAPYLDDVAAQGNDTTGDVVTKTGLVTPLGAFHSDVKAEFEGLDPYAPVVFSDVNQDDVVDAGDTVSSSAGTFELTNPSTPLAAPIGSAPLANPISVTS